MYVDLDLPVTARPARPLTLAVLGVAAAVTATILAVGGGVLAVFGRDVSVLLLPAPARLRLDGVRAAGPAPGTSDGPAALPDRAGGRIRHRVPYAYVRYAVVHSPGSLPFSTAALWVNTWGYAPATSLGAMVLLMVFPEGRLLSRRFRPALWAALAFIPLSIAAFAFYPQNLGPLFRHRHNPYAFPRLDWLFETPAGSWPSRAASSPGRPRWRA